MRSWDRISLTRIMSFFFFFLLLACIYGSSSLTTKYRKLSRISLQVTNQYEQVEFNTSIARCFEVLLGWHHEQHQCNDCYSPTAVFGQEDLLQQVCRAWKFPSIYTIFLHPMPFDITILFLQALGIHGEKYFKEKDVFHLLMSVG